MQAVGAASGWLCGVLVVLLHCLEAVSPALSLDSSNIIDNKDGFPMDNTGPSADKMDTSVMGGSPHNDDTHNNDGVIHSLVAPETESKPVSPATGDSIPVQEMSGRKPLLSKHGRACVYQNQTYRARQKFRPEPCLACTCPRRGGMVKCAIQDCYVDPNCVEIERGEGECCGRCKEYGCRHSDGNLYRAGTTVLMTSCEECACPLGGGPMVCSKKACPPLHCVDPVYDQQKCCATCPNGANCWLGERIIPSGVVVYINRCKRCQCPSVTSSILLQELVGRDRKALCTVDNC